jgi:hypothetical protein
MIKQQVFIWFIFLLVSCKCDTIFVLSENDQTLLPNKIAVEVLVTEAAYSGEKDKLDISSQISTIPRISLQLEM